ncbi:MAG: hypothetical protein ABI920_09895 [Casimicrobiaceae bacterium]
MTRMRHGYARVRDGCIRWVRRTGHWLAGPRPPAAIRPPRTGLLQARAWSRAPFAPASSEVQAHPSRRPRTAISPALLLAITFAAEAAVAPDGDAARFNPLASFESRCQALPPGQLEVRAALVEFGEDYGESFRTLSRLNENMPGRHRTVGLTQARLGYEFTLESRGLEDRRGGRVCARPSITVVFSATPMTVYVAREFADDDCRRSAIRDHEMKHVAVYHEYLGELVRRAETELSLLFGDDPIYARDAESARRSTRERLRTFMHAFMQPRYAELKTRQAAIDTAEEYERLARRCVAVPQG